MRLKYISLICLCILIVYSCKQSTKSEEDNEAPVVSILTPQNNDVVFEIVIISCVATDNEAVEKVELWLDGEYSGISDNTEPYNLEWNTTNYENVSYIVTVRVYDVNNNISDSNPIRVILSNNFNEPVADFIVSPESGDRNTMFNFDASQSIDSEDAIEELLVRWDWTNDGSWDTDYSSTKITTHQYSLNGVYTIKLEVKNTGEKTNFTTRSISVLNNEPIINSVMIIPNSVSPSGVAAVTVSATDGDNDALTYSYVPNGGTITGTDSLVNWIAPTNAGSYSVMITVTDNYGGQDTRSGNLTVIDSLTVPTTTTSTILVKTEPDLRAAVQVEYAYIIIENNITLTTSSNYKLEEGVIINGNGRNYGDGGKIFYANGTISSGAFFEMGKNSEIWGIRLIGDNSADSKGINVYNKNNVKIKNCEIVGFGNYAIGFGGNTSSTYKKGYISSNYIHDNQQSPYGYGIVINRNSEVYINNNKFKNNRHHVTSRDLKNSSDIDYLGVRYEASYNTILANTDDEEAHFDVHGNDSYGACGYGFLWDNGQAGSWIKIHHNQFLGNNDVHVQIRGVPVSTVASGGGYRIYNNNFGPNNTQIMTCDNLVFPLTNVAAFFTDPNLVNGDNFNTYVTMDENY